MHEVHHQDLGILNEAKMANSIDEILQAAKDPDTKSFEEYTLFYYEMYEQEFDEETRTWQPIPSHTIPHAVVSPHSTVLLGYDAAVFQENVFPIGCSPLSCNHLAETIPVNEYCLFPSLDAAIRALNDGSFDHAEPGPYRLYAVYRVEAA